MIGSAYAEDQFVEQPAIGPFENLGWGTVSAAEELFRTAERYLVVLADRGSYILPWTANYIQHENGHQKYLQRHARHTQKS